MLVECLLSMHKALPFTVEEHKLDVVLLDSEFRTPGGGSEGGSQRLPLDT